MKIKMKTLMSGPDGNAFPGQEIDIPIEQAQDLINKGYAIPLKKAVEDLKKAASVETATVRPGEKAVIYNKMNKKQLLANADKRGIAIEANATKKEIVSQLGQAEEESMIEMLPEEDQSPSEEEEPA